MNPSRFQNYRIILASQSPRRQYLLKEIGLDFEILPAQVDETYPPGLPPGQIALFLAALKADSIDMSRFREHILIIAADTIVVIDNEILGKPDTREEAIGMLQKLSGKKHEVITAVCLKSKTGKKMFHVSSFVFFRELTMEEIIYYIEHFHPFDKAGGYGIQEWIGYIGISKIEGSFFNVMGLPVKEVYEEMLNFTDQINFSE